MSARSGDRSQYFPAIERRYGHPIEHWWDLLGGLESNRYPDQMALLQEGHGFSRSHANAAVMSFRGSHSSRRYDDPEGYFASLTPDQRSLARDIFSRIMGKHPELELVIAWNQPMLRNDKGYVFGLSASTRHLSLNPFSSAVLASLADRLADFDVTEHIIRVPLNQTIDTDILDALVTARLAELDTEI